MFQKYARKEQNLTKLPSESCQQVLETPSQASTAIHHSQHILHTLSPTTADKASKNLITWHRHL